MHKEIDFINKSICKSHYLSAGWEYDERDSYDIFSGNAFIYLCFASSPVSFQSPFRVVKRDLFLKVREGFEDSSFYINEANPLLFSVDVISNLAAGAISSYIRNSTQEKRNAFRQSMLSDSNIHLVFLFAPNISLGGFDFFVKIINGNTGSGVIFSRDEVLKEVKNFPVSL